VTYAPLTVFGNVCQGTVTSGGTTAPAQGTAESWTVAVTAAFPVVTYGSRRFRAADPALPGEVFDVQVCPGGTGSQTWSVVRGGDGTTPVAHTAGFTVVQVIAAGDFGLLQDAPWQFRPESYGAAGDGIIGTGGTGTSGTATFSDSGASFVNATAPAGDVGKLIVINQGTGGSATAPFCGTISAVNSATSVTLSANLAANCASAPYIYGTDDAAAITSAVNAANTYATGSSGNYFGEVVFGAKNYMLGALTQQTTPVLYNTHIPVPVGTQYGQRVVIALTGAGDASAIPYWESDVPSMGGTCLVSAVSASGQPDGTYGQQSVIGGPTGVTAAIQPGNFSNSVLSLDKITIIVPWNSQQYGVHAVRLGQFNAGTASYRAFAAPNVNAQTRGGPYMGNLPTNGISVGFAWPTWLNNDNCNAGEISVEGAYYGVQPAEHFSAQRIAVLYGYAAIQVDGLTGTEHGASIGYLSAEQLSYVIVVTNDSANTNYPVNIGLSDVESIATGHVNDPSSRLRGIIYHNDTTGSNAHPVVTGGENLILIDTTKHVPGPWSGAPAAPSSGDGSTNTQQNLSYRYASIYLSATTITATYTGAPSVSTGLTSLGLTQASSGPAIMIRVLPGAYWSATYTGTLTAVWVLD